MPGRNNDNQPGEMELLRQRIAQLEAQAEINNDAREEPSRFTRGVTPMNSAFGGADFQPTGFAALSAFKPFGTNQKSKNASFDRKARKSRRDPGILQGNKGPL
jgi:hypothetical protein